MTEAPRLSTTARALGELPRSSDKPVKQRPAAGTCEACGRPLSVYNLTDRCAPCTPRRRT